MIWRLGGVTIGADDDLTMLLIFKQSQALAVISSGGQPFGADSQLGLCYEKVACTIDRSRPLPHQIGAISLPKGRQFA
jgi:hypothetical protein